MPSNQLSRTLHAHIERNRERYVEFLSALIRFDSRVIDQGVGGQEGPAQTWMAERLRELGADVHVFEPDNNAMRGRRSYNEGHTYRNRPDVVARWPGADRDRHQSIILNGHIDVMPPGDLSAWTVPPFDGVVRDGVVIGRGAVDMKGGLAAGVMAMAALRECGVTPKGDVLLESVVDEEGGGNGTLAACVAGYRADAAVILEGSDLEVHRASRGAWQFLVRVKGRATHSSMKVHGVSAIDNAIQVIQKLYELERHWLLSKHHPLLSKQTVVVGTIRGGFGASAVPGECEVRGVIEYLPVTVADGIQTVSGGSEVVREVEEFLRTIDGGFLREHPPVIEWTQDCPPFYTSEEAPIVQCALEVSRDVLGQGRIGGMAGGCDGRHLQYAGIPVIVCGPGTAVWAHAVDEQLEVSEYLKAIELVANLIVAWTDNPRSADGSAGRHPEGT
jgi:acetylornithine deacetylase